MFKNLFDLSVKRSGLNALGFYIVYVLVGGLLAGLFCAVISISYCKFNEVACGVNGIAIGTKIGHIWGPIFGMIFSSSVGCAVMTCKKLWNSVLAILLFILAVPLSYLIGCIGAFIFISIISTFENGKQDALVESIDQNNPLE